MNHNEAAHVPLRARDGSVRANALVDAADLEAMSDWRWHLGSDGYAWRTKPGTVGGKIAMHRQLLALADSGLEVDHINGDRLDNRRVNLRAVTHAENCQNLPDRTGRRGVTLHRPSGLWCVKLQMRETKGLIYGGYFKTLEEAIAQARALRAVHMPFSIEREAVA